MPTVPPVLEPIVLGTIRRQFRVIRISLRRVPGLTPDFALTHEDTASTETLGTITAPDEVAPVCDWEGPAADIGLLPGSIVEHGLIRLAAALADAYRARRPLGRYFGFRPDPALPIGVVAEVGASV